MAHAVSQRRLVLIILSSVLFVIGYPFLVHLAPGGERFGAFMIVPVTLIAWESGRRAALVAALVGLVFALVVFNVEHFVIRGLGPSLYWGMIVFASPVVLIYVAIVVGKFAETFVALQDSIGARDRLAETLTAAQRTAQQYLDIAGVMLLVLDESGKIILLNRKGHAILGYDDGELVGRDFSTTCLPERTRAELLGARARLLSGDPAPDYHENPVLTRNGDERLIAWHDTLIRDHAGKAAASLSSGEDITERRKAETAVRSSRDHLNAVMNALPDVMLEVDLEGVLYDYRASHPERLLFPQARSPVGRRVADIVSADLARTIMGSIAEAAQGGDYKSPAVAFSHDGKTLWLEHHVTSVGKPGEKGAHFIVLGRDVSERMVLQHQLIQSQKMEAVGRLTGGIAHDFNNILMVIIGFCDVIQSVQEDRPKTLERVKVIRESAERAAALTHQLLAFSRKQILDPEAVDVDGLVRDLRPMLVKMLGEDVELVHESRGGGDTAKVDPSQLQQVIMNLAVNARDAMPDGGRLTVNVQKVELGDKTPHAEMAPGRYVLLEVSDTGTGMDAETVSHLFEPFFTTKELGKGTGLGLSIVYGIVKQSDGYVTVESRLGIGTTFRVYLPSVQGTGGARKSRPDGEQTGTETILLVEDEDNVRTLVQLHLAGCGYTVLEATNGREALAFCEDHRNGISLLLTDIGLPGLKGWKVAEAFRDANPGGRIIYMTGYTDPVQMAEISRSGREELLRKPFSLIELGALIRRLLDEPGEKPGS